MYRNVATEHFLNAIPMFTEQHGTGTDQRNVGRFPGIIGASGDDNAKYERVRFLGAGAFGKTYLVRRVCDGKYMVAKCLDRTQHQPSSEWHLMKSEIQCMSACDHFAVIKYCEDYVEDDYMLIIMEYADASDLSKQIKQRARDGNVYFEEHEVGYTFVQLAMALDHVHRRRMLHRDVKGANVMLLTNGIVKLGDFGLSKQYDNTVSDAVASAFCGTPYCLAPELWKRTRYSKKADVWSLGILLFEMMALRRPYVGQGMKALSVAMLGDKKDCELPDKYSRELKEVCALMLHHDPNKRPSCAELFQLPYMRKLLSDFAQSVENSQLVSDSLKRQIEANVAEIQQTNVDDRDASTYVGHVGSVCTSVYYEGSVRKESNSGHNGAKEWKERFLVLRDGGLVISRRKGDKETRPLPMSCIASVVPISESVAGAPGVFAIEFRDAGLMWLQGPSSAHACEWIRKLRQAGASSALEIYKGG